MCLLWSYDFSFQPYGTDFLYWLYPHKYFDQFCYLFGGIYNFTNTFDCCFFRFNFFFNFSKRNDFLFAYLPCQTTNKKTLKLSIIYVQPICKPPL